MIKSILAEAICTNSIYCEDIIRNRVDRIHIFNKAMIIYNKHEEKIRILFE